MSLADALAELRARLAPVRVIDTGPRPATGPLGTTDETTMIIDGGRLVCVYGLPVEIIEALR